MGAHQGYGQAGVPNETGPGPGDKPECYQQNSILLSPTTQSLPLGEKKCNNKTNKKNAGLAHTLEVGNQSLSSPSKCLMLHGDRDTWGSSLESQSKAADPACAGVRSLLPFLHMS